MYTEKAKVEVKDSQNKVIGSREYDKVIFHGTGPGPDKKPTGGTPEELLSAAISYYQSIAAPGGNGVVDMLKDVTYARDLNVRQPIRQSIVSSLAGPEKAIDKAVKDLMAARQAMNKPLTEEEARKRVMASLAD